MVTVWSYPEGWVPAYVDPKTTAMARQRLQRNARVRSRDEAGKGVLSEGWYVAGCFSPLFPFLPTSGMQIASSQHFLL